ncbi:MAG: MarR family transcriptional regulator [Gemmatimonadota bacterium]
MTLRPPRPATPELPPVLEFLRALWSLNHALEVTSSEMHRRSGVTAQQRMVLRIVGHLGSVSAGMLSTLLHVHPGTLSAALRRLEGRGLLARQRAHDDARRVLVALTPLGERLLETTEGPVERAATLVLSESEPELISSALLLLEQISRALESRHEGSDAPEATLP